MPNGIKIALPGYNAETDVDPTHFSLYVDGTTNHVLVKEKSRGSQIVNNGDTLEITHSLGYSPMAIVMVQIAGLDFEYAYGFGAFNPWSVWADSTKLSILNGDSSPRTVAHILLYDQL